MSEAHDSRADGASQPMVEILLATYNGERFLDEQIRSLLAQTYDNVRILARDDGSRDGTVAILASYAAAFPDRFQIVPTGEPSGGAKWNFLRLAAASSAPYLAFCDQDDVWHADKIFLSVVTMRELEHAHGAAKPLLVFTDLEVVNDTLDTISPSFWAQHEINPENIGALPRLLAQNVVTGCTALINRPLAELTLRMPPHSYMHDWWMALCACIFGAGTGLRTQTVRYRQHGGNVVGSPQLQRPTGIPRWRYHDKRREQWEMGEAQAEGLEAVFGEALPADARRIVRDYIRCEHSPHRIVRVATMLRHGYWLAGGWRPNAAILWYLWDMRAGKRIMAEQATAQNSEASMESKPRP